MAPSLFDDRGLAHVAARQFFECVAGAAGLQPGDVIEQIDRQPVRSSEGLKPARSLSGSRPMLLLINRRGSSVYMTLRPRG